MQHAAPPLKITTGKFEVIASGLVHIIDKEVTFKLGGLTIQYVFKSESKGGGHGFMQKALIIS